MNSPDTSHLENQSPELFPEGMPPYAKDQYFRREKDPQAQAEYLEHWKEILETEKMYPPGILRESYDRYTTIFAYIRCPDELKKHHFELYAGVRKRSKIVEYLYPESILEFSQITDPIKREAFIDLYVQVSEERARTCNKTYGGSATLTYAEKSQLSSAADDIELAMIEFEQPLESISTLLKTIRNYISQCTEKRTTKKESMRISGAFKART